MTQIVTGPDGIEHEFPDGTSDDVIKGVMQKNYPNAGAGGPPTPSSAAGPTTPASGQPSFSDQLLKHIANAYIAPYQQAEAIKAGMTNFLSSYTGGLGPRLMGDQADVEAARQKLGSVLGGITGGAGYMLGPGKILGPGAKALAGPAAGFAGGIVPSVMEGTVAGGAQAAGEGKDVNTGMMTGAAGGAAAVPVGTFGNALIRGLSKAIGARPSLPSASDLEDAASNMWDRLTGVKYAPKDTQATARGAQSDASAGGQPMTEVGNPAAHKLLNQFSDYSGDPTSTHSLADLTGWQKKAEALTGDDEAYGKMLSNRIENQLQTATPTKAGKVDPADVPATLQQARNTTALVDQYNQNITNPPPTTLGSAAANIGAHSWNLAHHTTQPMIAPIGEAMGIGGLTYEHTGSLPMSLLTAGGTLAAQPAINAASRGVQNWQRGVSSDAANRALLGIDNPSYQDALRQLMLGGGINQVNQ